MDSFERIRFEELRKREAEIGEANVRLRRRVDELEEAIRDVVTQQGDDLCWLDVYTRLAPLVGIEFRPKMPPTEKFLANCARYEASLRSGEPYTSEPTT